MKIFVKAKPGAKTEKMEKIDDSHFAVSIKEPPVQGMANKAIIKVLSEYFSVSQSDVKIISGNFSKNKIIEIKDNYMLQ